MALYQHDLFKKLIDYLQVSPSTKQYLRRGSLEGLTIHDQSHLWSFQFKLTSILPFDAFKHFMQKMHSEFKHASVRVVIHVEKPKITGDLIKSYWPWVVRHCGLALPLANQLISNGHLKITNDSVSVNTKDESLRSFLVDGALIHVEDLYHRLGFPTFKFNIVGGHERSNRPAELITFKIEKTADDIKLARQAGAALNHDESK